MSTKLRTSARLALVAFAVAASSAALPQAAEAAGATTYYVSPTGNDANAGTSPTSPIRTLGRASGLGLNPGDSVLLQGGATFSGKLAVWRNGAAGSPITVGSFGTGRAIVTGDCLEVGGSYVTMRDLTITGCASNGIWTNGTGNVVTNIEATHNVHGIDVGPQAKNTKVVSNYLHHNDRMAPNTPGAFDDYGAVGVVVEGDNTEVAYNTITDNWAPSADFGTDGSAVEIYGGIGTSVHHNVASNNRTFTELGNKRSANTTYAYNQVTSSLTESEFLITRGDADYFGPVVGTTAVNNTVQLTGAKSLGFSCYAGCTASYFALFNNVLDVAGRIGYLEGSMSGGNNVYWRGRMDGLKLMGGDRYADPGFKPGQLVPSSKSPLVDTATQPLMDSDLNGTQVGVDGNGDGTKGADIGAYEAKGKDGKKGSKGKGGKKDGKGAKGKGGNKGKDGKKSGQGKNDGKKSGKGGKGRH
jgi:hypothetical protein